MLTLNYGDIVNIHNGNNTQRAKYTGPSCTVPIGTCVSATIAQSYGVCWPVCSVVWRPRPSC